ncbi:MAG: hypothetical protein AB4206_04155 [Xenococcaceae cyanobacterium]
MAKYKDIINEIKEEEAVNTELHKDVNKDIVSLTIKVPRNLRQLWVVEARSRGTTLSAVIVDYLKKELGDV